MNRSTMHAQHDAISAAAAHWAARCDAGLTAAEQIELEQWLAADPQHAIALKHYRGMLSLFDRKGSSAKEAVLDEMRRRARRRRARRLQLGAAMLLVFALGTGLWQKLSSVDVAGELAPGVTLLEPERRTLPDGSQVELLPGSKLGVHFDGATRSVELLRGEAHFQVVKDPARPFIVRAGRVQARAVGTAFAVELNDAQVAVLVTEGRVAIEKATADAVPAAPAAEPLATLGAGERMAMPITAEGESSPTIAAVSAAHAAEWLAWRKPRLEFSGTRLADAVALMNRSASESGAPKIQLRIDAASSALGEEPVSGLFRTDNVEAFVRVLELALGVRAERVGPNEIVLKAAPKR